jgi:hypothetical protein
MPSNFPTRAPIGLLLGAVLSFFLVIPIVAVWHFCQVPVQKFYFGEYLASYLSQTPVGTIAAFFKHSRRHEYYVLVQNSHLLSTNRPEAGSAISVRVIHTNTARDFHTWLRTAVYDGREVPQLLATPLAAWGVAAAFVFGLGAVLDFYRRKRAREGIQLRGGDLMTVEQFNRATRGDGFALYVRK